MVWLAGNVQCMRSVPLGAETMNSSSTSSVSKGCFVFKPSSKKKKVSFTTADYFNKGQDTDSENSRIRFEIYQGLWHRMKKETEQLQENLNKKLFDGLKEFFRQSHSEFQETKNEWSSRMRSSEIPTAALVLGVNVTDHDVTFKSLSDVLQESVTPYVASLHSKECPGIGQMVQKLLVQLMGQNVNVDYDEEDDQVQVTCRRTHCSMASLSGWYQSVTKKEKSLTPSKKRASSASRYWHSPPVVVIIKDLESFAAKVLQDFIIIISQYIHALPLILVFGIATSPMIIHRLLSHSVCSLLCIELFQSLSCTEHLATVVDKLLLTTQFPFKLSGKVLQVLISIFLYHDFSVHNFIKGLQLSLVEHFHSQPLSVLCCSLREARRRIQIFSHADCETLRQLPSFMRYVESQAPEKQVQLLTCDSSVKEVTEKLLEELHVYHENYIPVLRCLHSFTSILPKYPLGKQIRELHCTCMEKDVWESEEYAAAFQLLRMLAKEELVSALKKGLEFLKTSLGKQLGDAAEKMEEFLAKFQSPEGLDSGQVNQARNGEEEDISPQKTLHKTDLYHLQKTLLELKDSRRSRKLSPFEALRHEVVDFIDSLVRKYLVPPEMQTFYEVMYFSGAATLRRHLNAAPRIALHTALNNPYSYLKNDALKSDAGSISHSAPDICIAYKLHLECGRLINLYDWLEAFATVVTAAEDQESEPLDQVDEVIHARFIRAVSELELLGFVKATKQKTDHVARLTWGGC